MRRAWTLLGAVPGVALLAALVIDPAVAAASPTSWAVTVPPAPQRNNALPRAVVCLSTSFCMNVGYYAGSTAVPHTMARSWNGTAWRFLTTPSPATARAAELSSVSCVSRMRCVAVGSWSDGTIESALAQLWDGSVWSSLSTPPILGAALRGVSCWGAKGCLAVGSQGGKAFSERWDGTHWTRLSTPSPTATASSMLAAVSCISVTRCFAVGDADGRALAEVWSGKRWSIFSVPQPSVATSAQFDSVSCSSGTVCMAVGRQIINAHAHPLSETWSGRGWTLRPTPLPTHSGVGWLTSVSCLSGICHGVGTWRNEYSVYVPLGEVWRGAFWSIAATPLTLLNFDAHWNAVSCPVVTVCTTVGDTEFDAIGAPNLLTTSLYARWTTTWTYESAADPAGGFESRLFGVSCVSATFCAAIGYRGWDTNTAMTESWNGTAWQLPPVTLDPRADYSVLWAVSCASSTFCMAVGSWGFPAATKAEPLALRWDGSRWTQTSMPDVAGQVRLTGVSCTSPTLCIAVGTSDWDEVNAAPVPMRWDGVTWTVLATPFPSPREFDAVSCWSASGCVAVGPHGVAGAWNGVAWTDDSTSLSAVDLTGVSCSGPLQCVAVGYDASGARSAVWNGTTWGAASPAVPANASSVQLQGVSCGAAGSCVAVGGYCNSSVATTCDDHGTLTDDSPLVESWDGSTWKIASTPDPSRAGSHTVAGASCWTSTNCVVVGSMQRWFTVPYALEGS